MIVCSTDALKEWIVQLAEILYLASWTSYSLYATSVFTSCPCHPMSTPSPILSLLLQEGPEFLILKHVFSLCFGFLRSAARRRKTSEEKKKSEKCAPPHTSSRSKSEGRFGRLLLVLLCWYMYVLVPCTCCAHCELKVWWQGDREPTVWWRNVSTKVCVAGSMGWLKITRASCLCQLSHTLLPMLVLFRIFCRFARARFSWGRSRLRAYLSIPLSMLPPGYETFSAHHVWGRSSPMFIHHILTIPSAMDLVGKQESVTGQRQEIKGFGLGNRSRCICHYIYYNDL